MVTNFSDMKRIVPAILAKDKPTFRTLLAQAQEMTDYVQIDFVHESFADNKTVMPREIFHEDFGNIQFEAHIMADKDATIEIIHSLKSFRQCDRIIVHRECGKTLEDIRQVLNHIREVAKGVGIAISPGTDIREIGKLIKKVDTVLFLGVKPGFYGSEFRPEVLDSVRQFVERYTMYEQEISWDGGVTEDRLPRIIEAGATSIAVGSAIFAQESPLKAYQELEKLLV